MRQPWHGKQGFSLIEVLIGISILVVGVLGMAGLFNSGILMNRRSIEETQAANFALARLEEVRNLPFDAVGNKGTISLDTTANNDFAALRLPPCNTGPATWNRMVQVIGCYPALSDPNVTQNQSLKAVTVTIQWDKDPLGKLPYGRSVSLVSYVARTGMGKTAPRAYQ